MLPVEINVDDDLDFEDPREELVDRLIEYQKFKKLANLVEEKQDESEWSFERKKIQRALPFEEKELWEKIDTWDLLEQMQKIFKNLVSQYSDQKILDLAEEISVSEKSSAAAGPCSNFNNFSYNLFYSIFKNNMDVH